MIIREIKNCFGRKIKFVPPLDIPLASGKTGVWTGKFEPLEIEVIAAVSQESAEYFILTEVVNLWHRLVDKKSCPKDSWKMRDWLRKRGKPMRSNPSRRKQIQRR